MARKQASSQHLAERLAYGPAIPDPPFSTASRRIAISIYRDEAPDNRKRNIIRRRLAKRAEGPPARTQSLAFDPGRERDQLFEDDIHARAESIICKLFGTLEGNEDKLRTLKRCLSASLRAARGS
jgi:hypothetical protein